PRQEPRRQRWSDGARILLPRGVRVCAAGGRSSDSGLPPPPPSRVSRPSGVLAEERLPLQRRDRPGLAPEFPHRSPVCAGNLASLFVPGPALALDLDGVLADTRPIWDAWLEDAAPPPRG